MKFSTLTFTALSFASIAKGHVLSPVSGPLEIELVEKREVPELTVLQQRDISSFVEGLISDINVTAIIDSIDWEEIAGWANNLLTEDDNVKYLDYILNFLGSTNLVPAAISFILSNNETRSIAGDAVVGLLGVAQQFDITPVFNALKNSGLVYTLIADLIKNPNTLPFVEQVLKDTLGSNSLISGLLDGGSGSSADGTVLATAVTTGITLSSAGVTASVAASVSASINTANNPLYSLNANSKFGAATTTANPSDINTGSIAALISEAGAQASGNSNPLYASATTSAGGALTTTTKAALTTSATAAVTANAGGSGVQVGTYNLATITGPAFQSVPTSLFGLGPTTINYSALGQITAAFGGSGSKKRDAVYEALQEMKKREEQEEEEDEVNQALQKMKRDNIEDLLTTIFSSIVRSNLLNETIQYLVTDEQFENTVAQLLEGVFSNIGSTLTGVFSTDWSALYPLIESLLNSGLLTDTITRAFNDPDLKDALYKDFQEIFKRDLEARDEQVSTLVSSYVVTVSESASSNGTAPAVSTIDSENAGSPAVFNLALPAFAAIGLSALVM